MASFMATKPILKMLLVMLLPSLMASSHSNECPDEDAISMLQTSHAHVKSGQSLDKTASSGLAAIADYYVGRHSAPVPSSFGSSDKQLLEAHGKSEPLHPDHVASLLGVNDSQLIAGHPKRFFADGVLSEDACKTLRDMFDRHAPEMLTTHNDFTTDNSGHFSGANTNADFLASTLSAFVQDKDFPILQALRQKMVDAVRAHLDPKSTAEFTHFIQRKGHQQNDGMGTHADNCQYGSDGKCTASDACCAWRTHTVFTYLSDENVDGGEFYIARASPAGIQGSRDHKELDIVVQPRCGQMVGFSSGGENLHGVLPLKGGSRYAIGLWLTEDPNKYEHDISPLSVH